MKRRTFGNSGLQASLVGLGCLNFGHRIDLEASRAVIYKALDLGITLFDTADVYGGPGGSETVLGQVLGDRRKDVILATKFGNVMDAARTLKGASRWYIISAVEASLRRLKTDWIDLYQLHRPDPLTPIHETLRALDDLVHQGKVRYVGCSNLPAWQVVEAQLIARELGTHAFVSCQDEYSLMARGIEQELLPAIQKYGLALLPYYPLASGLLTGKYKRDEPPPDGTRFAVWKPLAARQLSDPAVWPIVDRLKNFSAKRNHTLLELAFSWLAAKPFVLSIIAGATKPEQVEQNVKAVSWTLTPEELAEVDRLSTKGPLQIAVATLN
ncbi:MAG TPA: aldo/keto reductase [Ktedonobacteraceae bacterium]|nr:aldo/keto reductase [Ktedonobacteraceae bacterium]